MKRLLNLLLSALLLAAAACTSGSASDAWRDNAVIYELNITIFERR